MLIVTAAQFLFTDWLPIAPVFGTRPMAVVDGLFVVGVGVALLLAVEAEKWAARRLQ